MVRPATNINDALNIVAVGMLAYERGNKFILFQRIIRNVYKIMYRADTARNQQRMVADMVDILLHKKELVKYAKPSFVENIVINGKYTDVDNDDALVFKIILHILYVKIKTLFRKKPLIVCVDDLQYMHPIGYLMLNYLISMVPEKEGNTTKLPVLFICTLESMAKSRDMVIQPHIPQYYTNFIDQPNVLNYKLNVMMPHMLKKIVTDLIDCVHISKSVWDFYEMYSLGNPTLVIEITKAFVEKQYFEVVKNTLHWAGTTDANADNINLKKTDSGTIPVSEHERKTKFVNSNVLGKNMDNDNNAKVIHANKESIERKLSVCFNTSSWIKGTRFMRLDRLHVLQQQVLKMASGVANIKRSNKKFNSLGLSGYFFSVDHLQAACPIESLIDDLEGVCDSLEETGVLCKAIDFRTKSVSFTFTDPFVCLAARSRCTMEVQLLLQEQVTLLEEKREADQRKRFIEKAIGNINLNEIIEAEILKSKNAKVKRMHGFASGFKSGWGGSNNLHWKTRFVKISNDLSDFHICKQNVNAFDSNDVTYEVVQTCDLLNMSVHRIHKCDHEKYSVPLNTTRCPLKIVTSNWSKKGKVCNERREFVLTLPDPSTAEKIIYLIEGAQHKIFDNNAAMKKNTSIKNGTSETFRFVHGNGKKNPMQKRKASLAKTLSARKMNIKKKNSRRVSLLDMEDYVDITVHDAEGGEEENSDDDNFDEKIEAVRRLSSLHLNTDNSTNNRYTIHLNILDVSNLQPVIYYSSSAISSETYVYCVVHLDVGNDAIIANTKRLNIGKRIHEGDITTSRAFTAVSSTNEWNVNTYFHIAHNGIDVQNMLKGIHGRIWERDFFGDDVMKGSFYIPFSMFEKEKVVCQHFGSFDNEQVYSQPLFSLNGEAMEGSEIHFKCHVVGNPPDELFKSYHQDEAANEDANAWINKYTLYHEGPIPLKKNYMSFDETISNIISSVSTESNNTRLVDSLNLLRSEAVINKFRETHKVIESVKKAQETVLEKPMKKSTFKGSKLLHRLRSRRSATDSRRSETNVRKTDVPNNHSKSNGTGKIVQPLDENTVLLEFNTFCMDIKAITDKYGVDNGLHGAKNRTQLMQKFIRMRKDKKAKTNLEKQFVLHSVYSVEKHLV